MNNNPEIKRLDFSYEIIDEPGDLSRYDWIFNTEGQKEGFRGYITVVNKQSFKPQGIIWLRIDDVINWISKMPDDFFLIDDYEKYQAEISKYHMNLEILHLATCYGGGMNQYTAISLLRCLKKYLDIFDK